MAAAVPAATPAAGGIDAEAECDRLALHLAVWDDDVDRLQALLLAGSHTLTHTLECVDAQGNTPLLLAYRMGRTKAARMLLAAGAFSKARAREGWEAVQVAALTANPDLTRESVLGFLSETDAAFARRLPALQAALKGMRDFEMRMDWTFQSWVPLVSRMLPSDTYCLYKRGSSLRLDTTLLGLNGMSWERGSVSLILWGDDMPRPGAMYVLDNEAKTAADARLAFTHPQDIHIQDWVRKLLTTKQKTSDFWSRDVLMQPVRKVGLFGSLARGLTKIAGGGDASPRGRVSEGKVEEPGSPTAAAVVHVDDPSQVTADIGVWTDCTLYEMKNLCLREMAHAPILPELKLKSWWKPEYSRQATEEDLRVVEAAARGVGQSPSEVATAAAAAASAANAAAGDAAAARHGHHGHHKKHRKHRHHGHHGSHGTGVAAAAEHAPPAGESVDTETDEEEIPPEKMLSPLFSALRAIRAGKINERNAASATMEELEGMGFEDGSGKKVAGQTVRMMKFEEYFGFSRPPAPADAPAPKADADASRRIPPPRPASDGKLFSPSGAVCIFAPESVTVEDKILDLKVYFSREFPIPVEQFLPVAEIMSRTGRHAENFRRFFDSKMPKGAGFPVRFTIPVFPTVTGTVTFEFCDIRRSPPKSMFEIPSDYKMGAYQEKGWIRQV